MLNVQKKGDWKRAETIVSQFERRLSGYMLEFCREIAEQSITFMKARIPDTEEGTQYKENLKVVDVKTIEDDEAGVAIKLESEMVKGKETKELEPEEDVIVVHPVRVPGTRLPEYIEMLEMLSPWPMDMIPVIPHESQATIIYRKVSKDEVGALRQLREQQMPTITAIMRSSGISMQRTRGGMATDVEDAGEAIPDIAFHALRMEFGIGGYPGSPHWRPMLHVAKNLLARRVAKDSKMSALLYNPSNTEWKNPKKKEQITLSEAAEYADFQKKVAGR